MAIDARFDAAAGVLRVTVVGDWPTLQEQKAARQALLDTGTISPETPTLIDLRGAIEQRAPDFASVRAAIELAINQGTATVKRAFLTSTPTQRSTARMILELGSVVVRGANIAVFTNEGKAIAWLLGRPPAEGAE